MQTVTFLKAFTYRHKLARKDAWQSTLTRYKAGVPYDVTEAVIACAIELGALEAPATFPDDQTEADGEGATEVE